LICSSAPVPPLLLAFLPVDQTMAATNPEVTRALSPELPPQRSEPAVARSEVGEPTLLLQICRSVGWHAMPLALRLVAFVKCGSVGVLVQVALVTVSDTAYRMRLFQASNANPLG